MCFAHPKCWINSPIEDQKPRHGKVKCIIAILWEYVNHENMLILTLQHRSLGVLLFTIVFGRFPFYNKHHVMYGFEGFPTDDGSEGLLAYYCYHDCGKTYWRVILECRSLIEQLLRFDPCGRPSLEEVRGTANDPKIAWSCNVFYFIGDESLVDQRWSSTFKKQTIYKKNISSVKV
jgi:serine/threonine protein kinase